jgi:predicted DNA-binding transcriptional regulator YafY
MKELSDNKNRLLLIQKYLWEQTDEAHPASIADIQAYLENNGLAAHRRTITGDIDQLLIYGIDVVHNKSSRNMYFVGDRVFELPEIKLLIDAVQSCRFISPAKSDVLTGKLALFASVHQAESLKRQQIADSTFKPDNKAVYMLVDMLYTAIDNGKQVRFQYYEYTPQKEKILKHNGQIYEFSPYALVWRNDAYYVLGYSASHGKVIKFRIDRMCYAKETDIPAIPKPDAFSLSDYMKTVFQMFDSKVFTVELLCENTLMKSVIDRFGEDVDTRTADSEHFIATAEVSVSPTFYAWVFTFANGMKILSPEQVKNEYCEIAKQAIRNCQ